MTTRTAEPTRREQILATAAELFAARGFHGVSVADLGAACGISGPALYKHFASKDAVLAEMLVSISEELLAVGRERSMSADGPRAALRRPGRLARRLRAPAALADRRAGPRLGVAARRCARAGPLAAARVRRRVGRPSSPVHHGLRPRPTARAMAHAAFGLINSTPHSGLIANEPMGPC